MILMTILMIDFDSHMKILCESFLSYDISGLFCLKNTFESFDHILSFSYPVQPSDTE